MQGTADIHADHNRQRKAAVINDFTSFGRCSLAVTIPILSAMKVQCCPVPTAFFTNHTGFDSFAWTDNTPHLDDYVAEWLIFICVSCSVFSFNNFFSFIKKSEFLNIKSFDIWEHIGDKLFLLCFIAFNNSKPVFKSFTLFSDEDTKDFKYF